VGTAAAERAAACESAPAQIEKTLSVGRKSDGRRDTGGEVGRADHPDD